MFFLSLFALDWGSNWEIQLVLQPQYIFFAINKPSAWFEIKQETARVSLHVPSVKTESFFGSSLKYETIIWK